MVAAARLTHAFPTAFVVALSGTLLFMIRGGPIPFATFTRAIGVVLLSQIAVGTLNDYVDRHDDALTQPDKPIPSGILPATFALTVAIAAAILLPAVAEPLGLKATSVALVGLAGGIAYDIWLKRTVYGIVGYLIGFLSLVTFLWLVVGHLSAWFLLILPSGAGLLLAAHLANSYPDVESDQRLQSHGLAARLGAHRTRVTSLAAAASVECGGLLLAVAEKAVWATFGFGVGILGLVSSIYLERSLQGNRRARLLFFRGIAASCGMSALAGVLLIRALSG